MEAEILRNLVRFYVISRDSEKTNQWPALLLLPPLLKTSPCVGFQAVVALIDPYITFDLLGAEKTVFNGASES